ncbi:hypothetical protein WK13_16445 [Burkholderia ubonensis]|nr:hypothetical protein WK13_16445 [Burkholderia ubonensis]
MILVWYGQSADEEPWPMVEIDFTGYSSFKIGVHVQRGHLHNILENTFDLAHYSSIHGWEVQEIAPSVIDRHCLKTDLRVRMLGVTGAFHVECHGLGCQIAAADMRRLGLQLIVMTLPTQLCASTWMYYDFMAIKVSWLSKLPHVVRQFVQFTIVSVLYDYWFVPQLTKDINIWNARNYTSRPRLARSDVAIAVFRKWAARFYSPSESKSAIPS